MSPRAFSRETTENAAGAPHPANAVLRELVLPALENPVVGDDDREWRLEFVGGVGHELVLLLPGNLDGL